MPWVSIIVALLTFLLQKSNGKSTKTAALTSLGAGLATYVVADPANPDNLLGISFGEGAKTVPGDPTAATGESVSTGVLKSALSETGETLRSWGPGGTLGVIAGTTAIGAASGDLKKWLPWILGLGAIFLLTR